jgi:hypothetical protein
MTAQHWTKQLAAFAALNPSLPRLELSDVLASQFVDSIV